MPEGMLVKFITWTKLILIKMKSLKMEKRCKKWMITQHLILKLLTGYLHHFPFLSEDLKLKTHNRLYPPMLYKGVVWQNNHNLFYLGMQDQFHTFNMFDAQAWYVRDIIMNKIKLPSDDEISNDINSWVSKRRTFIYEDAIHDPND